METNENDLPLNNIPFLTICQDLVVYLQMAHSTNVSITLDQNGGGTIKFCPKGSNIEALRQFHSIDGGHELVNQLLHEKDIDEKDASALRDRLNKHILPAESPNNAVRGLSHVLGGQIITPSGADIRRFGNQ